MNTRRFLIPLISAVVVCGLGGAVAYRFSGVVEKRELAMEMARAKKIGLPFTHDDVWGPPIPAARNAALIYAKLEARESALNKAKNELKKLDPAKDRVAVAAALKPVEADLALLEKGASRPDCRFERAGGWDARFGELSAMRSACEVLGYRAQMEAAAGDPLKAMWTLSAMARVAAHMGKEPMLITKLVQSTVEESTLRSAQIVLTKYGRRADVRTAARGLVTDFGPLPNFKDSMRGEWYFQRVTLDGLDSGKIKLDDLISETGSESQALSAIMRAPGLRARQELTMVRHFMKAYQELPDDPTEVAKAIKVTEAADSRISSNSFDNTLSNMFLAVFSGGPVSSGRALAGRRTFLALLTALDAPTPPKKLPAKGADAVDPFTGNPLHYRGTRKEIRIWSVGPDKKDDAGLLKRTSNAEDVTSIWPR